MSIVNLLNKHTGLSADLKAGLLHAAAYLNFTVSGVVPINRTFTTYITGMTRRSQWGVVCQDRLYRLSAVSLNGMNFDETNAYTLVPEALLDFQIADYFYLANDLQLPVYSYIADTVLTDVMANSFAYMCYTDSPYISLAYANMAMYQSLVTGMVEARTENVSQIDSGLTIDKYDMGGL